MLKNPRVFMILNQISIISKHILPILTTISIFLLFLSLRLVGLKNDMTNSDAIRWHERSENFISAILKKDFTDTYQKYHPGVTLMWINGLTKYFVGELEIIKVGKPVSYINNDWYGTVDWISKSSLVITLFVIVLLQFLLLVKIFDIKTAQIYLFFVAVEPYLIGIDRWFHLTSLETYLSFLAFLFVYYFTCVREQKYLVLSGVVLGLAILTKISAFFYLPLLLLMIFRISGIPKFRSAFILISSMLLTVFSLFPALWVDLLPVLTKIFIAGDSALDGSLRIENTAIASGFTFYPLMFLAKLGITTSILFILSCLLFKKITSNLKIDLIILIFILLVAFTISGQKIDRYLVSFIPAFILLITLWLKNLRRIYLLVVLSLHVVFSVMNIYLYFPIMSAYLLPNEFLVRRLINQHLYDNSGEYFRDAADYLNNLKEKNDLKLKVFIPDNVDTFRPYFKGILVNSLDSADFVVVSLDIDRVAFPYPSCRIEETFGNSLYRPVAVLRCSS